MHKRIHLVVEGKRTTVNINEELMKLLCKQINISMNNKFPTTKTSLYHLTPEDISLVRKKLQREIDLKDKSDRNIQYRRRYLRERLETYMIYLIADPKLL